jgi:predicted DNA-binding protein
MNTAISVRLPDELVKRLDGIAKGSQRTRSFIIQKALEYYVEEVAGLQIAYDRLHDADDPVISGQAMSHTLGLYGQALAQAKAEHRTVAEQIEFRAMIGRTALDNPDLPIDFVRDLLMAREEGRSQSTSFFPEGHQLI